MSYSQYVLQKLAHLGSFPIKDCIKDYTKLQEGPLCALVGVPEYG